jgi:type I restriction enzyme S subunit
MLKEKKLVPQLRFSEFGSKWENTHLGDLVDIKSGNSPSSFEFIENGKYPFIKVEELNNCIKYQEKSRFYSNSRKNIVSKNSILFPKRGAAILNNKIRISSVPLLMDSNMMALECQKNKILHEFLFYKIIKEKLYKIADTSTIPQLNNKHIIPYRLRLPSLEEQQKIANFLTVIDIRIQTLEKKKTLLEQYKKGVMQKIFKQELRFKDEGGKAFSNWKLKRIGEVFKERNEKNFKYMELLSVSISKGIYSQSKSNKKDNSNSDKSKYKRVLKDDIAYNSMRMWQGASAVSKYDGIVSPAYTILEGNEYQYSIFYGYLFKMSFMIQTFQKHSQGLTSDTWNLKYPMISKIKINVPSLKEQTKIAKFLSAIDENIALVTKKIEHTKTYKKGLLQQMFV